MFNNILVASDGSDDALRAAEAAAEIAEKFGSRIVLVTVYGPPMFGSEPAAYEISNELIAEIQTGILEHTAAPFVRRKLPFDSRAEYGNPAATIVSVAEQEGSNLIVLGSHGTGGIRRFLLGSVSDRVGHYAHCTVLVIKRDKQT